MTTPGSGYSGGSTVVVKSREACLDEIVWTPECPYGWRFIGPLDDRGPITLDDLVGFRPAAPTRAVQPNGWAIAGLPANFTATAPVQTLDGELLGFEASVRFTPAAFHWSFGDGASRTTPTGGRSWTALGLPEFSETSTSHVYAALGSVSSTVTVDYQAEYRFAGDGWTAIAGTLPVAGPAAPVMVTDAETVLVPGDCRAKAGSLGC